MIRRGLRSPRVLAVAAVVLSLVITVVAVALATDDASVRTRSEFLTGTPEGSRPVRLDTTLYLPEQTPAPAVLLAHGLGGTKRSVDAQARRLVRGGYVVLAYSARGFGASGGLIHLDAPAYEVNDARLLVTYLAGLPEVKSVDGEAQIGVAGGSYGGGLALLLAGSDRRIKAVGADATWNDLTHALFPNATGTQPGVFKKMWAGLLFSTAASVGPTATACGRYAPEVCAAYQRAARTGRADDAMLALLRRASPAAVLNQITAPTLLTQGEQDSLFPLSEADANARGIAANGTPVRVAWRAGGHDRPGGTGDANAALQDWLDEVFSGSVGGTQPFDIAQRDAALSAATGQAISRTLRVTGYPGADGAPAPTRTVRVSGPPQRIAAPAGGLPAAVSSVPGVGGVTSQVAALAGRSDLSLLPGQTALFRSPPLPERLLIAGASTVRLTVTAQGASDATLFLGLRDVDSDGTGVLPSGLVAPLRLSGLRPGLARTATVQLPSVVHSVPRGHRLELSVATTDLAYALPSDPRSYTVALAGGTAAVTVPTAKGEVLRSGHPTAWLVAGILTALLVAAAVGLVLRRRRHAQRVRPELADVPVTVEGLVKSYGEGIRAVDDVSFRVERGQVVGLLGPNGAGKTTALRLLVGLITPTAGTIHVFGQPLVPGAPVLARLGAFIEGPGFLPHLTGRQNLQLYWAATGRPDKHAQLQTALDIAGLGSSIDRRVKAYSHGMKQRLGIAQAMLGLPEVLVLDEPTNGLDPPQIAEMREVLQRYAQTGRTVVVSSHLLAEVEQTCTHVVVMHRGRLVAAGTVAEIAGAGRMQLAVADPEHAAGVLAAAGIEAHAVPARRALEDVFLDLVGEEQA